MCHVLWTYVMITIHILQAAFYHANYFKCIAQKANSPHASAASSWSFNCSRSSSPTFTQQKDRMEHDKEWSTKGNKMKKSDKAHMQD